MAPTTAIPEPGRRAAPAWNALERALLKRRWQAVEPVLRFELALVALLLAGFLFLQLRGPFETLEARFGAGALAGIVAALGLALACGATAVVARRHAIRLRQPEGPAWFALPLEPAAIERHLARSSSLQAAWMLLPAAAVLASAAGLVAPLLLPVLGVLQVGLLAAAASLGCALARRRVGGVVAGSHAGHARPRLPAARFRRDAPWAAIARKDALVVRRRPELSQGAIGVVLLGALSFVGWLLPGAPGAAAEPGIAGAFDLRHIATFFVTLIAAAALAEWMVGLVGADPFAAFRVLPLDVGTVWRARAAWILAGAGGLVLGHAALAHGLALGPRLLFLAWIAGTTIALATLGLNLALTLYPRTGPARPLLALTLGVMAIASVAVFLSGWFVLVVAVVATTRRLSRWERSAEESP